MNSAGYLGWDHATNFIGQKVDFVAEHQIQDRPKQRQEKAKERKEISETQEGVFEVEFLPIDLVKNAKERNNYKGS